MTRLLRTIAVIFLVMAPQLASAYNNALNQQLRGFVANFWSQWSQNNTIALPYLRNIASGSINFYGKAISSDDFMKIQTQFANRWPSRSYTLQPNSLSVVCNNQNTSCKASGLVNWIDSSPVRSSTSIGMAKFAFSISVKQYNGKYSFQIASESGSVVHRTLLNGTPVMTQSTVESQPKTLLGSVPKSNTQEINIISNLTFDDQKTCRALDGNTYKIDFGNGNFDTIYISTIFVTSNRAASCEVKLAIKDSRSKNIFEDAFLIGDYDDVFSTFQSHVVLRQFAQSGAYLIADETSCGAHCGNSDLRIFRIMDEGVSPILYLESLPFDFQTDDTSIKLSGAYDDGSCDACMPTKSIRFALSNSSTLPFLLNKKSSDMIYYKQIIENTTATEESSNSIGLSDFLSLKTSNSIGAENLLSGLNYDYGLSQNIQFLFPSFKRSDETNPTSNNPVGNTSNATTADSDTSPVAPLDENAWYNLTNDNQCVPSTEPSSPAALIEFDKSDHLDDDVNIFATDSNGNPVAVKVGEPEANDMVSTYTFFRGKARCEAYANDQRDQLQKLQ